VQVFSTDTYKLIHVANLDPGQWNQTGERTITYPDKIHVLDDTSLLGLFNHVNFELDTCIYYRMDYDANINSDKLIVQNLIKHLKTRDGTRAYYDPFGGRGMMAFSSENQIYTAWSDEMLFKVYDIDGTYRRSFYHPFNNSELDRNEALNFYEDETFKNALQNEGIPTKWRAFEHFIIDDNNNIWVSTIIDNRQSYEWWVMDKFGELLAKFKWPKEKEIKKVQNNFAYTIETEHETGVQHVNKYRIEWNSKSDQ